MKKLALIGLMLVLFTGISLASTMQFNPTDPCGVVSLGKFRLDVSKSEAVAQMPRAELVENFKKGFAYSGSSKCPGTFEIVDLHLTIQAARDVKYDYDQVALTEMQSMEDFMLVRYFNDAQTLIFSQIKVKNASGEVIEIPSVRIEVK